jgi:hypothetical protein
MSNLSYSSGYSESLLAGEIEIRQGIINMRINFVDDALRSIFTGELTKK